MKEKIAKYLLDIGAVELRPNDPFTWTSGIKSPIYCDNRLTLSYPKIRKEIAQGMVQLIKEHFPEVEVISGTATAGIPHAAWVADLLDLPMNYVRSSAKGHGKQNQIEGVIKKGDKVVVIEDLISTGKSSLQAAQALREQGAVVLGVVAIFTYNFEQAKEMFQKEQLTYVTLSDYLTLIKLAQQEGILTETELEKLKEWQGSLN